jgi:hypothetical protein
MYLYNYELIIYFGAQIGTELAKGIIDQPSLLCAWTMEEIIEHTLFSS